MPTKHELLFKRLKEKIPAQLQKELGIKNKLALPRLEKVIVNTGINKARLDSKEMHEYISGCMTNITGQKTVLTRAKKSISNFKVREGMVVGSRVTLRGRLMVDFLDRLIAYVMPRIRDFRGLPGKLDGHGNFAIGIRDHSIFPEVLPPDAKQIFGIQIQICTTADNDEHAKALLQAMGMPFRPEKNKPEAKEQKAETVDLKTKKDDTESPS